MAEEKKIKRLVEKAFKGNLDKYTAEIVNASANIGENYLSSIHTVKIKEKEEDNIKFHLFVKVASPGSCIRNSTPIREMYERETHFYVNILPKLIDFQQDKNCTNFHPFAKIYAASFDEGILMDNLKVKNFKLVDHRAKLDFPHALLIIKEIGKFHALSFAIRDQKPEFFKYLENSCPEIFYSNHSMKHILFKATENIGKVILGSYDPCVNGSEMKFLGNFLENLPRIVNSMLSVDKVGKYAVLNHGDIQIRNIMFKYDDAAEPHIPTELCLLDWQIARLGSPALDILFFIFVCTEKELRDHYYTRLIEEYYQSLSSFLRQLGSDPQVLFPYEILLQHLTQSSEFGLFNAIWVLALIMRENDDVPDMFNVESDDAFIQMMSVVPKRGYMERIHDVISDLMKYDYVF
ncbi:hypothetical protein RI129_008579 [Pyrocoelia pectoralis]|uniref:CHK kinase-like domain-containing protein n=1 Tax=Pyrocoelia pectoralis TaxID=417401 RepID=A0AAN7ZHI8_9COLE